MRQVTQGSTNISVDLYIVDDTDGTPETGVLWNTAGIDLEYRREGAAAVNVTEATLASLTTAHTDGGFLEIGHGYYRFDVPDAAFASGALSVSIQGTVTGMVVLPQTIQLVAFDTQDSTRLGLTALPNANADAAGGLPISDAGNLDLDAMNANIDDIEADTAAMQPQVAKIPLSDGSITWNATALGSINAECDTAVSDAALATAANLATVDTNVDAIKAKTDSLTFTVANQVDSNAIAVSGDTTAADNLEAMYDGTGYTDETGPASRSQVASIGASSGSAINYAAIGDNTGGALKGATFVGTQTNLYTDTRTVNGTKHEILHATNVIDIVYQFNIGSISTPVETEFVGLLNSSNDTCSISVYSYDLAAFEQVGTLDGQNDVATNITENIKLLPDHASDGTTDNIGDVFLRIQTTGSPSSPTLKTDALFLSAVAKSGTLGFENASVWIDTVNGTSGTAEGTGTASNPSDNIADARTIADDAANNLKKFHVLVGSSITLAESFAGYAFVQSERGFICNLNGQSVSNCYFMRARIQGNDAGVNAPGTFYESCRFDGNTLGDHFSTQCTYAGTVIFAEASSTYTMENPRSNTLATPITIDFDSNLSQDLIVTQMSSNIEFLNSVATTTIKVSGVGGIITLNANCTGGTLEIEGNFTIVDNSGGALTISDDARYTIQQVREEMDSNSTQLAAIVADTNELQSDDVPTLIAALPTAAEVNAEVVDVLETDTHAEPASAVGATASIKDSVNYIKAMHRNKMTQTATTTLLRNDADTGTISTSTVSDDGTTFTKGKHT